MKLHEIFEDDEVNEKGEKIFGAVLAKVFITSDNKIDTTYEVISPMSDNEFKSTMHEMLVLTMASEAINNGIEGIMEDTDEVYEEMILQEKNETLQ